MRAQEQERTRPNRVLCPSASTAWLVCPPQQCLVPIRLNSLVLAASYQSISLSSAVPAFLFAATPKTLTSTCQVHLRAPIMAQYQEMQATDKTRTKKYILMRLVRLIGIGIQTNLHATSTTGSNCVHLHNRLNRFATHTLSHNSAYSPILFKT